MLFSTPLLPVHTRFYHPCGYRCRTRLVQRSAKRWQGTVQTPDAVEVIVTVNGGNPLHVPVINGHFEWMPPQPMADGEYQLTFTAGCRRQSQRTHARGLQYRYPSARQTDH